MLLKDERQKFLAEQWPRIFATIQRLGFSSDELLTPPSPSPEKPEEDR
jgi:hypothetical protein